MSIPEIKPQTTFGKFENIDMRVARVLSAEHADGTKFPCRVLRLDLGELGERTSVGQYALIDEEDLVGSNVVVCVNLGSRQMGPYSSDALVLGAPHPESPDEQSQALPISVPEAAVPGSKIY